MTVDRSRPPVTRNGTTRKIRLGRVTLYVTLNRLPDGTPCEMFGKADEGNQGQLDALCLTASLAMQHGVPLALILRHWRGMRYPPDGIAGQGSSIPDAIARALGDGAA